MNFDNWKKGIISTIFIFADLDGQRKLWVEGSSEGFSSWEEAYCQLFDDYDFDGFIKMYCCEESTKLSANICKLLKQFRDEVTKYGNKFSNIAVDPEFILSDPDWQRICNMAKALLDQINYRSSNT